MDPYYQTKPPPHMGQRVRKNYSALFFLILLGCAILFFSIVLVACAFVVNYHDNYEVSGTNSAFDIEEKVQSEFHYAQYWAGVPFIVTGILVIFAGIFQRSRGLTIASAIFCVLSIALTFFVISLDGPNWRDWDARQRTKTYWERKSGVDCATGSTGSTCECKQAATGLLARTPSLLYSCSNISQLSALYGAIVGSAICIALVSIFALLVITKSLSWKQLRRYRKRSHHQQNNDYYMDDMDQGQPPITDLPYAKHGYFGRPAPMPLAARPYKQEIYRNYPY